LKDQVRDGTSKSHLDWVNLAVTAVGNMLKGNAQDGTSKPHFKRVKLAYLPRETSVERPSTGRYQTIPFHLRWKQLLKDHAEDGNSKSH